MWNHLRIARLPSIHQKNHVFSKNSSIVATLGEIICPYTINYIGLLDNRSDFGITLRRIQCVPWLLAGRRRCYPQAVHIHAIHRLQVRIGSSARDIRLRLRVGVFKGMFHPQEHLFQAQSRCRAFFAIQSRTDDRPSRSGSRAKVGRRFLTDPRVQRSVPSTNSADPNASNDGRLDLIGHVARTKARFEETTNALKSRLAKELDDKHPGRPKIPV